MEDGEIEDTGSATASLRSNNGLGAYDPSYEWPGEPSISDISGPPEVRTEAYTPTHTNGALTSNVSPSSFRLLTLRTSILPSKHKLVLVDGYSQLQFGRDVAPTGTDIPRVRLKEMEVSKLHATAFWDAERLEWSVVDMGSMHGTFLKSMSGSADEGGADLGVRLSPPRVASVPRRLRHLDRLTIGSTTFLIHIHEDQVPCVECSPGGGDEIPLFPVQKSKDRDVNLALKRSRDAAGLDLDIYANAQKSRDPKKALTMLKRSLLSQQSTLTSLGDATAQYIDRSARRRALHPSSHPDVPGVPSPRQGSPSISATRAEPPTLAVATRQPPTPLPSTNIGHRLLMRQGWEPGSSLGISQDLSGDRVGLIEPLEVNSSTHRAGLGMPGKVSSINIPGTTPNQNSISSASASASDNWKECAKYKRWATLKLETMDQPK